MKLRGIKLLSVGGLVLIISAAVFSRVSNSLDTSPERPPLAALASLYSSSDPYVLTSLKSVTAAGTPSRAAESTAESERRNSIRTDFSPYVMLHMTRIEYPSARDGID